MDSSQPRTIEEDRTIAILSVGAKFCSKGMQYVGIEKDRCTIFIDEDGSKFADETLILCIGSIIIQFGVVRLYANDRILKVLLLF